MLGSRRGSLVSPQLRVPAQKAESSPFPLPCALEDRSRPPLLAVTHVDMCFLGVYRAIYDYAPQAEGELAIGEGDLLYVLENNEDDGWWKAKRKAGTDEDDEPEGLVPNNYIEPVRV